MHNKRGKFTTHSLPSLAAIKELPSARIGRSCAERCKRQLASYKKPIVATTFLPINMILVAIFTRSTSESSRRLVMNLFAAIFDCMTPRECRQRLVIPSWRIDGQSFFAFLPSPDVCVPQKRFNAWPSLSLLSSHKIEGALKSPPSICLLLNNGTQSHLVILLLLRPTHAQDQFAVSHVCTLTMPHRFSSSVPLNNNNVIQCPRNAIIMCILY